MDDINFYRLHELSSVNTANVANPEIAERTCNTLEQDLHINRKEFKLMFENMSFKFGLYVVVMNTNIDLS